MVFHRHHEYVARVAHGHRRLPRLVGHEVAAADAGGELTRRHGLAYTRIAIQHGHHLTGYVRVPQIGQGFLNDLGRFDQEGMCGWRWRWCRCVWLGSVRLGAGRARWERGVAGSAPAWLIQLPEGVPVMPAAAVMMAAGRDRPAGELHDKGRAVGVRAIP